MMDIRGQSNTYLKDKAIKRLIKRLVEENEEMEEYEKGYLQKKLVLTTKLLQSLYPNEPINFLDRCTVDQLDKISTMLIRNKSMEDIYSYLKSHQRY